MDYIILSKAVEYCEYSQEYLSLRARSGNLKAKKIGRNWFTTKEWLEQYLKKNGKSCIIKSDIGELKRSRKQPVLTIRGGKTENKKQSTKAQTSGISKHLRSVAPWNPISFLRRQNILDSNRLKKSFDFYHEYAFNVTKKVAAVFIGVLIVANILVFSTKSGKISQFATMAGHETQMEAKGLKNDFNKMVYSITEGAKVIKETPQNFSLWINTVKKKKNTDFSQNIQRNNLSAEIGNFFKQSAKGWMEIFDDISYSFKKVAKK